VTLEEVEDGSIGGPDEEDAPWVGDVHLLRILVFIGLGEDMGEEMNSRLGWGIST
jgi:hypothetical protein